MRKNVYIILIVLFLIPIIFSLKTAIFTSVSGQSTGDTQSQLNAINSEITQLNNSISQNNKQISVDESTIGSYKSNIQGLQSEINSLNSNLSNVNSLISQANTKRNNLNSILDALIANRDNAIKSFYENSYANPYLEALSMFSVKNVIYFANLEESYINQDLANIQQENSNISSIQNELSSLTLEEAKYKADEQKAKEDQNYLSEQLTTLNSNESSLMGQISNYQSQLSSLNQEEQNIINSKQQSIENAINTQSTQQQGGTIVSAPTPVSSPVITPTSTSITPTPSSTTLTTLAGTECSFFSPNGAGIQSGGNSNTISVAVNGAQILRNISAPIQFVPSNINEAWGISSGQRTGCYSGSIEFRVDTNANFIEQTSTEDYVAGIGEMPDDWGTIGSNNALEAQLIASRTYGLYIKQSGKYNSSTNNLHYDITNTTQDQSYIGIDGTSAETYKYSAETSTNGDVLENNNSLIEPFFSANNGGYERSNIDMGWSTTPYPYLPSQVDGSSSNEFDDFNYPGDTTNLCQNEYFRTANPVSWNGNGGVLTLSQLTNILGASIYINEGNSINNINTNLNYSSYMTNAIGNFQKAEFTYSPNGSGYSTDSLQSLENVSANKDYINSIVLYGQNGTYTLGSISFYMAFNLLSPLSDFMSINNGFFTNNSDGTFTVYTYGFGHSIGMSQCGALGRAESGQNFNQILGFYYPNTNITTLSGITSANPNNCLLSDSGDECIRIGLFGFSPTDNSLVANSDYTIVINSQVVYSGKKGDKIEEEQF